MEPQVYTDDEMFAIMGSMEEVNRQMVANREAAAPTCHFRKMRWEHGEAADNEWWECSVCGHTKVI